MAPAKLARRYACVQAARRVAARRFYRRRPFSQLALVLEHAWVKSTSTPHMPNGRINSQYRSRAISAAAA